MTVPVVLAIAGVIGIFLGIWGGGIKAKEIEVPVASSKARLIVGFVGLVFLGISIWLSVPTPTNLPQASPTSQTSSSVLSPSAEHQQGNQSKETASVYDDFEVTTKDGSFNQQLWRLAGSSSRAKAYQQEGKLTITDEGIQKDTAAVLVARNFDGFTIRAPFFLEAEMAHFRENPGNINVGIYNTTTARDWGDWSAICTLYYSVDKVSGNCSDSIWPQQTGHNFETPVQEFLPGTWHKFRIEIDPDQFKITYYIDGVEVGSHIPEEAEALKKTSFQVTIGIWKSTEEGIMLGHFDNIGIGEISP